MDELIVETLNGKATPAVQAEVARWRAESPQHEAHYRELALVWAATAPAASTAAVAPVDPAVIIAAADRRRGAESAAGIVSLARERERRQGWRTLRRGLAVAAGIGALAVSVRLLSFGTEETRPFARYVADQVSARTVVLDDGSLVRLAPGSRVDARSSGSRREVSLTGRAFFAVAHDPARPFVVRAGNAETRVLGTRFEVARRDSAVRTIVVEGRVTVSNPQGTATVTAGSVAYAPERGAPTTTRPADLRGLLDWAGGLLLFQGTPLALVAEEVAARFGRSVLVEDAALRALRITGSFEQEGFDDVVNALCETTGARCTITAEGAVIAAAEPRR